MCFLADRDSHGNTGAIANTAAPTLCSSTFYTWIREAACQMVTSVLCEMCTCACQYRQEECFSHPACLVRVPTAVNPSLVGKCTFTRL